MQINEIEWNNGQGLEDLAIHGIGPVKALAEHLAEMLEQPRPNDGKAVRVVILETVIKRLSDIDQVLERFMREVVKLAV